MLTYILVGSVYAWPWIMMVELSDVSGGQHRHGRWQMFELHWRLSSFLQLKHWNTSVPDLTFMRCHQHTWYPYIHLHLCSTQLCSVLFSFIPNKWYGPRLVLLEYDWNNVIFHVICYEHFIFVHNLSSF
jgi:hypothetical protein